MIYEVIMMSGKSIVIESEEALVNFLEEANSGKKLVLTKYGIPNVASIDSITPHKKKMEAISELMKIGRSKQEAEQEALGPSPFAKLLSGKMKMLSDKSRTEAQEEASKQERKQSAGT